MNAPSFRRGFLGPWDGLAEPAMAVVAMVCGDVPWFAMYHTLKIFHVQLRAINVYRTSITLIYDLFFAATIPTILVLCR